MLRKKQLMVLLCGRYKRLFPSMPASTHSELSNLARFTESLKRAGMESIFFTDC